MECSSWRSPDRARRPRWPCPPRPQHPQTHLGCWCSCSCATGSSARSSLGHRGNRQDVAAEPVRTVCFTSELAQDLRAVLILSCSDKQVILPWGTQKHPESVFFYAEVSQKTGREAKPFPVASELGRAWASTCLVHWWVFSLPSWWGVLGTGTWTPSVRIELCLASPGPNRIFLSSSRAFD